MKAILYTSDPYEPSGVIGLYETEEQKESILKQYINNYKKEYPSLVKNKKDSELIYNLKYIEIPIGIYGEYY